MNLIALIFALLKAISAVPAILDLINKIAALWTEWRIQQHDRAFSRALAELIKTGDPMALEEAAGMPNAGKPAENQTDVETRPARPRP